MGINNVGNDAPVCVLTYLPGGCCCRLMWMSNSLEALAENKVYKRLAGLKT